MLSGDTLYCKLEKKKKHPEESPYTALGTPFKQTVFTNQAFNENADPDHVYANAAHENGGHDNNDNSSVYDNLKSGLSSLSVVYIYMSVCLVSTAMTAVPPFMPVWNLTVVYMSICLISFVADSRTTKSCS